jgi:hypothetical protein
MIYVISGNYAQFLKFCSERNISSRDAIYIDSAYKLKGKIITKDDEVVYYGTWSERKDIDLIQRELRIVTR